MKTRSLAVLILALAAGCAPTAVTLTQHEVDTAYDPGQFAYAGAGRDLRTVVVGNPFGGDAAAFEAAVTDAMQGQHWGQSTHFTTTPDANARTAYRVVMLFDPPASLNATRLCRGDAKSLPTARTDDGITLFGAFCRGEKDLTSIKGRVTGASDARSPEFRDLVGRVTRGLFPPDRGRDRDREPCLMWLTC